MKKISDIIPFTDAHKQLEKRKRDTTITNAFREGLSSRATDANMGLSDSLEVFFIYGQTLDPDADAEEKKEESRIILYPELQNIWDYYGSFPQDSKFILRLFINLVYYGHVIGAVVLLVVRSNINL